MGTILYGSRPIIVVVAGCACCCGTDCVGTNAGGCFYIEFQLKIIKVNNAKFKHQPKKKLQHFANVTHLMHRLRGSRFIDSLLLCYS